MMLNKTMFVILIMLFLVLSMVKKMSLGSLGKSLPEQQKPLSQLTGMSCLMESQLEVKPWEAPLPYTYLMGILREGSPKFRFIQCLQY